MKVQVEDLHTKQILIEHDWLLKTWGFVTIILYNIAISRQHSAVKEPFTVTGYNIPNCAWMKYAFIFDGLFWHCKGFSSTGTYITESRGSYRSKQDVQKIEYFFFLISFLKDTKSIKADALYWLWKPVLYLDNEVILFIYCTWNQLLFSFICCRF